MRYIITLSSGKDSEGTLWWAYNTLPFDSWEVVFDETDWDKQEVYDHLKYLESRVGKKFIVIKSKGFRDKLTLELQEKIIEIFGGENVFAEMVIAKKRFPSTKARFCTVELKSKPMIDFILDEVKEDVTIIQGVRAEESEARRNLKISDEYFKFYLEPYGYDKKGKPLFHTYRKAEILAHLDKYEVNVHRPVLKLSANEVFNIIFENNSPGNALYKLGLSRVGCWPCVNCGIGEIKIVSEIDPGRIEQLEQLEQLSNSTFFPPGFIPTRFCSKTAKCEVYREDLLRLFGGKAPKIIKNQSSFFNETIQLNPEERLYQMYFKNDKIPVYLDENGDEYIIRSVKVPTIRDVVKYVKENPNQVDLIPRSGGCVSVYNICESPAKAS